MIITIIIIIIIIIIITIITTILIIERATHSVDKYVLEYFPLIMCSILLPKWRF